LLQYVFAGLYLVTQATVMALYIRTASLPPWSLALLCASRRLHSIFLLRLFNDCWAMAVAYLATLALQVLHVYRMHPPAKQDVFS
jgi:alpha-1,3-mannosyltransferase